MINKNKDMKIVVVCYVPKDLDYYRGLMEKYSKDLDSIKALKLPPHLTIVSRFKTEKYDELIEAITNEISNHIKFNILTDSICFFESPSIIKIDFKTNKNLKILHDSLLDLTSKYSTSWTRKRLIGQNMSKEQKDLICRYGSPFVKQFYTPHMTLAGEDISKNKFKEIIKSMPLSLKKEINFDHINIMLKTEKGWVVDKEILLKQ